MRSRERTGKRPAPTREAARVARRDRVPDRSASPATRAIPRGPAEAPSDGVPALPVAGLPIPSRPHTAPLPDPPARPRRKSLWSRAANRRVTVQSRSLAVWLGEHLAALGRRLLFLGKILAALLALATAVAATRVAVRHVVASPRFAVQDIRVASAPLHVAAAEIIERTGVQLGDRLLAVDTDGIAARLARHPWISSARVRRELPGTLVIDVTERHAAAVAVLDGLYLLDEQGHPFKRATLEEADGQVVLTGISRMEYLALPRATEAAFREALAVLGEYQHPDTLTAAKHATGARPALSEVHVDPHNGFSLFLYDGGAEIRLGRGAVTDKLARLDEILAQFGPRGLGALKVVHLDGPASDRVPIRLAAAPSAEAAAAPADAGKSEPRAGSSRAPGATSGLSSRPSYRTR
jgi:cell division protein FtsQ